LVAGALGLLAVACAPVVAAPPLEPTTVVATRANTFPALPAPKTFAATPPPAGALVPGTKEWYRAPAPDGRAVVLGVYRPTVPSSTPPVSVLVLHGNDGFRQRYEVLARRFASAGMIGIVGCWFDRPEQPISDAPDATSCSGGPTFKGAQRGVPDLNALVDAVAQVTDVDPTHVVLVGHSYGATVALDRAAAGGTQPVVSSAGLLARTPPGVAPPAAGDMLPADPGQPERITVPLLLAHGEDDPIVPIGQARAFERLLADLGRPPTVQYYAPPAGHSFPFSASFAARFVTDVTAWIAILTFTAAPVI